MLLRNQCAAILLWFLKPQHISIYTIEQIEFSARARKKTHNDRKKVIVTCNKKITTHFFWRITEKKTLGKKNGRTNERSLEKKKVNWILSPFLF